MKFSWIVTVFKILSGRDNVFERLERLAERLEKRCETLEDRVDELELKIHECEADRERLHDEVNALKKARGIDRK